MIIVIAVIIGGVAAAFFAASTFRGRKKKHIETAYSGSSTGGSGTFCTNCGAPAGSTQVLW